MNNYNNRIWVLITRDLTGEATPVEKNELQEWLDEDPKHREFYRSIASFWKQEPGASVSTPFFFDYESGVAKLRNKLGQQSSVQQKRKIHTRRSSRVYTWTIAASALLMLFSLSVFVAHYMWEQPDSLISYVTSDVEQRIITLQDGSVVRLNRDSKIEIQENLTGEFRKVRLEGEAFFDVAEDSERPFIIHVDDAVVQVLGTSFNIKQGREVMIAVQEGLVSFRHMNHDKKSDARLSAGHFGLMAEDGHEVVIEEANIENYLSWMNGYLRFESMPFDLIITQLERIYGVKHEVKDASIISYQLTMYSERIQQIDKVLESIARALDLTYEKQGDTIIWQKQDEALTGENEHP